MNESLFFARAVRRPPPSHAMPDHPALTPATMLGHLKGMVRQRALRARHLPAALFEDPAWDMLVDLMIARLECRPVCVSDLAIASGVPMTTGLRWIGRLDEAGLIARHPDRGDRRRTIVRLTAEGVACFEAWFAAAIAAGPAVAT